MVAGRSSWTEILQLYCGTEGEPQTEGIKRIETNEKWNRFYPQEGVCKLKSLAAAVSVK